jgi:Spy/CpxP family protein refolding chaperone
MNFSRLLLPCALTAGLLGPIACAAQQSSGTVTGPAAGQQAAPGEQGQHHGGMMAMMRNLNLTDAQMQQIRTIRQQYRQAHPEGSPRDPQAEAAMRASIMNVLTPAQRTQFEQNMQAWRAQHPGGYNGGQAGSPNGSQPAAPSSPPPKG